MKNRKRQQPARFGPTRRQQMPGTLTPRFEHRNQRPGISNQFLRPEAAAQCHHRRALYYRHRPAPDRQTASRDFATPGIFFNTVLHGMRVTCVACRHGDLAPPRRSRSEAHRQVRGGYISAPTAENRYSTASHQHQYQSAWLGISRLEFCTNPSSAVARAIRNINLGPCLSGEDEDQRTKDEGRLISVVRTTTYTYLHHHYC